MSSLRARIELITHRIWWAKETLAKLHRKHQIRCVTCLLWNDVKDYDSVERCAVGETHRRRVGRIAEILDHLRQQGAPPQGGAREEANQTKA